MTISVPAGSYYRINCALVLEDEPVQGDSRLGFETFPESIEEVYALTSYREIGADRMPQPGGVAYRGGNWSTFSLTLQFRAGSRSSGRADRPPQEMTRALLEQELQEMERKARWCQALAFPLRRDLGSFGDRILRRASSLGPVVAAQAREALSELRRGDPPKVLIVFGSWMTMRGYVENVSLKWEPPFDPQTNRPYGATVTLGIKPLLVEYPTWQTIRGGAWSQQSTDTPTDELAPSAAAARDADRAARQQRLERSLEQTAEREQAAAAEAAAEGGA